MSDRPHASANSNAYYCLATIYGEMPKSQFSDRGLASRNRAAWNWWMAARLSEEMRADFIVRGVPAERLTPSPAITEEEIRRAFTARVGSSGIELPDNFEHINFNDLSFDRDLNFSGFFFPGRVSFFRASFDGFSSFSRAIFADASHAVLFARVEFRGNASFQSTRFLSFVNFSDATFENDIDFLGSSFGGRTIFVGVTFRNKVPDFRGAILNEATEWHRITWPDPPNGRNPTTQQEAQEQVYRYERLKQEMDRLKKHIDESIFFTKELRARRTLEPGLSLTRIIDYAYEVASNYGNSILRPILGLFLDLILGFIAFATLPVLWGGALKIPIAAALSISNVFPFLSIRHDFLNADALSQLTRFAEVVCVAQSVFGLVMLFLLLLATRNRFRIK